MPEASSPPRPDLVNPRNPDGSYTDVGGITPHQSLYPSAPPLQNDQEGVSITVSPTGRPVIPPALVPYVLAGLCAADLVREELTNPAPWDAPRAISLGIRLVTFCVLGASPGWRRK